MSARLKNLIEAWGYKMADHFFAKWPQKKPTLAQLNACRLVAHRGEFDNGHVLENTLPAFDAAVAARVWGIEFDIRWTADLVPVICHDPDLTWIFGDPARISELSFHDLRARCPHVPAFTEMVDRYGGRCHLMIELKEEPYPNPAEQGRKLHEILQSVTPIKGFHLLSFDTDQFDQLNIGPPDAFIAIARLNARELSQRAIHNGYAGVGGHYLLVGNRHLAHCQRQGLKMAIGFVNSANSLFREVNRRVDWLFSDRPVKMQQILDQLKTPNELTV
jgi:glycerophosphoryl diester phosphodiesterase